MTSRDIPCCRGCRGSLRRHDGYWWCDVHGFRVAVVWVDREETAA